MSENPYQPPQEGNDIARGGTSRWLVCFGTTFGLVLAVNSALLFEEWRELRQPKTNIEVVITPAEGLLLLLNLPAVPLLCVLSTFLPYVQSNDDTMVRLGILAIAGSVAWGLIVAGSIGGDGGEL